jgi:hypothetical protein
MMFAIDLLKGKALPAKIDLKKSIFKAVPLLIPVLAVSVLAGAYRHDKQRLQTYQQILQQQQQEIEQYAADVAEYNAIQRQVKATDKYLEDISKALSYRVQVSDVLCELVGTLPESIFIYEMEMDRNSSLQKIQQENSAEVKQKLVIKRKLKLVLCGFDAEQTDLAVQKYLHQLQQSPLLSKVFTEIKHSARQQGQIDDKDAIYYEIECTLREQGS